MRRIKLIVYDSGGEIRSYAHKIDENSTVTDIVHYGNTGITDDEIKNFSVLDKSGGDISGESKAKNYSELHFYPRADVYPQGRLPWKHVAIVVGPRLRAIKNVLEPLRRTMQSFGADVHIGSSFFADIPHDESLLLIKEIDEAICIFDAIEWEFRKSESKLLYLISDEDNLDNKGDFNFILSKGGLTSHLERGRLMRTLMG